MKDITATTPRNHLNRHNTEELYLGKCSECHHGWPGGFGHLEAGEVARTVGFKHSVCTDTDTQTHTEEETERAVAARERESFEHSGGWSILFLYVCEGGVGRSMMGLGEFRDSTSFEIQERGEIYFFFRPKVGIEEPHSSDDVERLYLVLRPEFAEKVIEDKQSSDSGKEGKFRVEEVEEALNETDLDGQEMEKEEPTAEACPIETDNKAEETNGPYIVVEHVHKTEGGHGTERVEIGKKPLFRYIVMGRKSLPPASNHSSPYWGFVELVTSNSEDLKKVLVEDEYDTKTHSHRVNPAARPVGEGMYSLVRHETATKTSTYLVYQLEHPGPHKKHELQEVMNIEAQGSFVIQIKNPEQPAPASTGMGSKRRAFFPAHLQGKIGSRRFLPADPPDLLNYEGAEFILVSAHDYVDADLGLDIKTSDSVAKDVPDLVDLLGSHRGHKHRPIRPLIEGAWV